MHPQDDRLSVYLFLAFGGAIVIAYMLLYRACRRALMRALRVKFGCESLGQVGRSLEHKLAQQRQQLQLQQERAAAAASGTGKRLGGAKMRQKRRDISDVQKDLRPFTDVSSTRFASRCRIFVTIWVRSALLVLCPHCLGGNEITAE